MASAGAITPALRDAALPIRLQLLAQGPSQPAASLSSERKAAALVRGRLAGLLDVPRSYDLDRLDLTVSSTLDAEVQRTITRRLRELKHPSAARAAGLYGSRLLDDGDDPARLAFSFTLFERGAHANLLRVQTDSNDQAFDINEGASAGPGFDRQAAHPRHLPGTRGRAARAMERPEGRNAGCRGRARQGRTRPLGTQLPLARRRQEPGGHARSRHGTQVLGQPGRGLFYRRRPAPLRELRPRRRLAHAQRARGAATLGEPGVHPADA